jgi:gluconolactonase
MVTAIPGVIAAGAKWEIAAVTFENADGITGGPDGSVMWASPPTSRVSGLDKDGHNKVFFERTNGAGAIGFAADGRVFAMMRDKTSNGGAAPFPAFGLVHPETKVLADNYEGDKFKGAGDLAVDNKGGVFLVESGRQPFPGIYYYSPEGTLTRIADGVRANGITLSLDEKTLYLTNREAIVAFAVQPDGMLSNPKEFGKLDAGAVPDGLAIDAAGRLYVAAAPGIQVFGPTGEFLGAIPSPRAFNSLCFAGPDKKWVFGVGNGAVDADGKEHPGSPAKTIYKIPMLAQGFTGRPK